MRVLFHLSVISEMMKHLSLSFLVLFVGSTCLAQVTIKPKPSQVLLVRNADNAFTAKHYALAIASYEEALSKSTDKRGFMPEEYLRINHRLAEAHRLSGNNRNAVGYYAIVTKADKRPETTLNYGRALLAVGQYTEANAQFITYLGAVPNDPIAEGLIRVCQQAKEGEMRTASVDVQSVPFNTSLAEFAPSYFGQGVLFASARKGRCKAAKGKTNIASSDTDIYLALPGSDGQMSRVEKFGKCMNGKGDQGATAVSKDLKTVYYTTSMKSLSCKEARKGLNTLVIAKYDRGTGKSELLPFNSNAFNTAHPTLSEDGSMLYFASDRAGGKGGMDLYSYALNDTAAKPINLGDVVNTKGNEVFPYIAAEGDLYFASDAHPGLGGLDLFVVHPVGESDFGMLENLKAPFNSGMDDFGYTASATGELGYFSSKRDGNDDIFAFSRSGSTPMEYAGFVKDAVTGAGIPNVKVEVVPVGSMRGQLVKTATDGSFAMEIRAKQPFNAEITAEGYESRKLKINSPSRQLARENELLLTKKTGAGASSTTSSSTTSSSSEQGSGTTTDIKAFSNLLFEKNKWTVLPESRATLDQLAEYLNANKGLRIELSAFTDSQGPELYNLGLSVKRADAASKYLSNKGIAGDRITSKFYGFELLAANCDNDPACIEAARKENRRIEIRIIP